MIRRLVRARREPLSRGEDIAPVFLVGSGRSGTTLMRRLLMTGSGLYIPPEVPALGPAIADYRATLGQLKWRSRCRLVLGHLATIEDFELFPSQVLRPVLRRTEDLPRNERSLARIVDAFYAHMAGAAGFDTDRWGDKTPASSLYLDEIYAVYPRARFVHLLRDGFDVVASFRRMGRFADAAAAARSWERRVDACLGFADRYPDSVRTVRYERLVTGTHRELQALCEWLSLPYDADAAGTSRGVAAMGDVTRHAHYSNVSTPVTADHIGKGRTVLSEAERAQVAAIIGSRMTALGYKI